MEGDERWGKTETETCVSESGCNSEEEREQHPTIVSLERTVLAIDRILLLKA